MENQAQHLNSAPNGSAKQSTGKQLVGIIFMLAMATKMFLLPIYLLRSTGRDAYIIMAINGAADLVSLVVMLAAIKKAGDADFFELMVGLLGKIGAKIAVALIALFLFFKLNISVGETLAFYGTNVFTDFNKTLMIIVLLVFLAAAANHTLRSICRLNEFFVPIVGLCLAVLIAIVIMTSFDLANIFPALQNTGAFKHGLISHASWLGDFTPLILFVGRTKMKKHTVWFAGGAGVIGTCVALFFAIVMSAAFGNVPTLADTTTNISNILQFSMGNVYGRIDMISSILWSIAIFIEAALFSYAVCRCVAFVIGKNFHFRISLGVCAALYIVQVFALVDPVNFSAVYASVYGSAISTVFGIAAPVLALIGAVVNNKRGKQNNDNEQNRSVGDKTFIKEES